MKIVETESENKHANQTGAAPKEIETQTQITLDDMPENYLPCDGCGITEKIEEEVIRVNPDVNSMESRG